VKPSALRGAALFLPFLILIVGCIGRGPRIDSIDPRIGNRGEVLTIQGSGFRNERGESRVLIAGTAPTASSYIEWSDARIAVRIPDFGESGLVYVDVDGRKSNPALYTNRASVPLPISSEAEGVAPKALSVEPAVAPIGAAVTITGRNFGAARENGAVLFSWNAETLPSAPAAARAPDTLEASELEFGYEMWSDREIRVRVPDGAVSGNLRIRTARGLSDALFFEVSEKPGTKTYKDKRTYVFTYSADLSVARASAPNTLFIWMPIPVSSPYQRNRQMVSRSAEPFVEGHRGASLFQFKDLAAGNAERVTLSYLVDSYAVETQIKATALKRDLPGPVRSAYTLASPLVPSDNKDIAKLAEQIVGKERNPYLQARKLYDWLVSAGGVGVEPRTGGALQAFSERKADAYSAALLFCAFARARGIPSLPVSGYLVDRDRSARRHWWAEFWIDGFGWIPVDPALGAGAAPPGFAVRTDAREYYFGNLDNQRVVFSRGQAELSPMDPRGKTVSRTRTYAFQSIWEESVGGLDSYSTLWNDIAVSGVY
jgi:transglutaminase-like putative cysteine protease